MTISTNIAILAPELIVAVGGMALLLFGAIRGEKGMALVSVMATGVLAVAAWFVMMPLSPQTHAFGGAFTIDDFARFAKLLILLGSATTLLMAQDYFKSQGIDKFEFPSQKIGEFDTELVEVFWQAVAANALMNLHVVLHHGRNSHHISEAIFKATARALRAAVTIDLRQTGVPSSKGVL